MPDVTFVDAKGRSRVVGARDGSTVMETATENDLPSIIGFCGGMCSCGTCHCYVPSPWAERLTPPDANELDTLEHVLDRKPTSRLGCQIRLRADLDGLTVELPARQCSP